MIQEENIKRKRGKTDEKAKGNEEDWKKQRTNKKAGLNHIVWLNQKERLKICLQCKKKYKGSYGLYRHHIAKPVCKIKHNLIVKNKEKACDNQNQRDQQEEINNDLNQDDYIDFDDHGAMDFEEPQVGKEEHNKFSEYEVPHLVKELLKKGCKQPYVEVQRNYLRSAFGESAMPFFDCGDLNGLLQHMGADADKFQRGLNTTTKYGTAKQATKNKAAAKKKLYLALSKYQKDCQVDGNKLLKLLRNVVRLLRTGSISLPNDFRAVSDFAKREQETALPPHEVSQVHFPPNWNVSNWNRFKSKKNEFVEVITNDAMAIIAMKLIDPKIWGLWGSEIKFDAQQPPNGTVSHFMEGTMAHSVAERRNKNALIPNSNWKNNDIMFPIGYYNDGVKPDDGKKVLVEVLLIICYLFSPEMQQKPFSPMCIGYINHSISGMTEESIIKLIQT